MERGPLMSTGEQQTSLLHTGLKWELGLSLIRILQQMHARL